MGQNIKPSADELKAIADALLRSKRPPDPVMAKLQKKAIAAKKKQWKKEIYRRRMDAIDGGRDQKAKAQVARDTQRFGKLGPASPVRHIKPTTED